VESAGGIYPARVKNLSSGDGRVINTCSHAVRDMSWFHFTKQERLQRNRQIRREHAETAKKHAGDNIYLIPHEIEPALKIALDEERTFEEYFGEQLPAHMKEALNAEIALWQRLAKAIDASRGRNIGEPEYQQLAAAIREFLIPLIDLLHAEEEMITSCLQVHYTRIVCELQRRASTVKL
jgi:hypothetical protein